MSTHIIFLVAFATLIGSFICMLLSIHGGKYWWELERAATVLIIVTFLLLLVFFIKSFAS